MRLWPLPLLLLTCLLAAPAWAAPVDGGLKAAIASGDLIAVQTALLADADPNGTWLHDGIGLAPALIHAVSQGDPAIVEALLEAQADPNGTRAVDQVSALCHAATLGDPGIVALLCEAGANLEYVVPNGPNALSYAAYHGHLEVVRTLLDHGANPETRTSNGDAALWIAVAEGHEDVALLLLERGADPMFKNSANMPLFYWTVQYGRTTVVRELLDMGIDPDGLALGWPVPPVVDAVAHLDTVQLLAERGADLNRQSASGNRDVMTEAVWNSRTETVRWLLDEQHFEATGTKGDGTPYICLAAGNATLETINLLLDRGADPLRVSPVDGRNAWGVAIYGNRGDVITELIARGVDPATGTPDGHAAWTAAWKGNADAVRALVAGGSPLNNPHTTWGTTPLYEAIQLARPDIVQILLEGGADPNIRREGRDLDLDVAGVPPLSRALISRQWEVAAMLLDHGADPDESPIDGAPPVYQAIQNDRTELLRLLLDKGADPNTIVSWMPVLSHAAYHERPEMVDLLLEHGANPNAQNLRGQWLTPLMTAAYHGNMAICTSLLEWGADPLIEDFHGLTAESVARDGGHQDVVQLIHDVLEARAATGAPPPPNP